MGGALKNSKTMGIRYIPGIGWLGIVCCGSGGKTTARVDDGVGSEAAEAGNGCQGFLWGSPITRMGLSPYRVDPFFVPKARGTHSIKYIRSSNIHRAGELSVLKTAVGSGGWLHFAKALATSDKTEAEESHSHGKANTRYVDSFQLLNYIQ